MRSSRACLARTLLAGIWVFGVPLLCAAQAEETVDAAASIYVRQDTNETTVISPRVRAGAEVADGTRADVTYTVDVWTSASVDIVTAATPSVTEQRDELDVRITQSFSDLSLTAGYRYSNEHDYLSHGASLGGTLDLAQNNTTLDVAFTALFDEVGQAGNPNFALQANTFGVRGGLTQVLDADTLLQLVYELGMLDGYLSSPYRRVPIADNEELLGTTCVVVAVKPTSPVTCIPEVNPNSRMRHALAARGRRALGEVLSVGLAYRFYLDDWSIMSHTAEGDIAWVPSEAWLLSLGYRFYTQSAASHYKPFYTRADQQEGKHFTSDKELSPMTGHRVSLEVTRSIGSQEDSNMRVVLLIAPSFYSYSDFPRLNSISALEATLALEFVL
ncbi:MAG: DUF3570 domain-containing protein [Myxococcales bacterium]|nr:DUF3570 domain-containing protein [Myxococcales bacterium]MDD9971750.1 DUF3570 domain-containing protein [Myxococcales bacterium]